MAKEFIVVFTNNNARIIVGGGMGVVGSSDRVVSNPDLSAVRGIPPHLWKLEDGRVIPMNADERKKRLASRKEAENYTHPILVKHLMKKQRLQVATAALAALAVSLLAFLLLRK